MQRFAIIGMGRFGQYLAKALTAARAEVIGVDRDARVVELMRDEVALAVRLDGTDKAALESQGISEVDAAIVGIGEDFESAVLTVVALKELGVRQIIARAMTETQAAILSKVGADAIASAERESAVRWAHRLTLPNLQQYIELGEGHSIVYMRAPSAFWQKSLQDLELRRRYGVNLVAIHREVSVRTGAEEKAAMHQVVAVPKPDTTILRGDILILVGSNEGLSSLPRD
jgi:trk system potassium uptake protein TrkA